MSREVHAPLDEHAHVLTAKRNIVNSRQIQGFNAQNFNIVMEKWHEERMESGQGM
jgi:hypothetical protein